MEKIEICYICGREVCEEDITHHKTTYTQFEVLLNEKAGYSPDIAYLKSKVRKAFSKLQKHTKAKLDGFIRDVNLLLDKLHFWYLIEELGSLRQIEAAVFGSMLAKKQVTRLVAALKKEPEIRLQFPAYKLLAKEVHIFKRSARKVAEFQTYGTLMQRLSFVIDQQEYAFSQQKIGQETPNCFKQLTIEEDHQEFVLIEGIPFNTKRNTIDLSMLEVNDHKLARLIPALEKMPHVTNLQLRNNSISKRGFRMLFNTISELEELDLSNSDSGQFLEAVVEKLPRLKAIYLNQTGMNSLQKIQKVMQGFPKLKVLFLDNNEIPCEVASSMADACLGLFYVSLRGNSIPDPHGHKLSVSFMIRGGYLEY